MYNNKFNKYYITFVTFIIIIIILLLIFRLIFTINKIENFNTNKIENYNTINNNNKYVCMYAYYEKNDMYKENFKYFLDNVVLKKNDIDYFIIINGNCTVELPNEKENNNIKIIRRENIGFDFGAWSHCIKKYINKSYDYYIFLNTSVKGPFPADIDWLQKFLDLFKSGPTNVKLVGTSINVLNNFDNLPNNANKYKELYNYNGPYTHVQSMFFILDNEGFNILNNEKFFDNEEELNKNTDLWYVIFNKEIRLSQLLLKKGYNINSILTQYKDVDYTKIKQNFNPTGEDPYFKNTYFGNTITKEEVIFFKTNRL